MALLVSGSASLTYGGSQDAEGTNAASDGDPAAASATDPGQDASGGTPPPKDQAKSDADLMKNFTRHRPGACPEGPPCHVED